MQYDEDDPDDRRKSQVLMMAKLDEIERVRFLSECVRDSMLSVSMYRTQSLAQFSPRKLAIEDLAGEETPTGMPSIASLTPPPSRIGVPPTPRPSPQPGFV